MKFAVSLLVLLSTSQASDKEQTVLGKLLADPKVAKLYEQCQKDPASKHDGFDMGDCIWQKIPDDKERERIQAMVEGYNRDISTTTATTSNPAVKVLEDYYAKKLREVLYPESDDPQFKGQRKVLLNHAIFNKLFRTQLGKNIVASISSYCLEANPHNQSFIISSDKEERQRQRKVNIKLVGQIVELSDDKGKTKTSMAYNNWSLCATSLQHICYNTDPSPTPTVQGLIKRKYEDLVSASKEDFKYSKQRACEVISYIKSARQRLIVLDKIDDRHEDIVKENAKGGVVLGNTTTGIDVDAATNISSGEALNKSGYKKAVKEKVVALAEECAKKFDPEKCKPLLGNQSGDKIEALHEYDLRSKVVESKLEKLQSGDKKEKERELKRYLASEGHSKEKIEELIENDSDGLAKQIVERFQAEREELRKGLAAKIKKDQISTNDDPKDPEFVADMQERMKAMAEEMVSDAEKFGQLVFFNNMVSGFLQFKDEGGSNTSALKYELANSAYDTNKYADRAPAGESPLVDFEAISKSIGEIIGVRSSSGGKKSRSPQLDVDTINESIIDYQGREKEE